MPRIVVTEGAVRGLQRCRDFLRREDPAAGERAAKAIATRFRRLEVSPEIGRLAARSPSLRELTIPFGKSGYVALYRHDPTAGVVYILAFRHMREAGY